MKKYIYQKFLLNCDYESVQLELIPEYVNSLDYIMPYGVEFCFFDMNNMVIRKILLNNIDNIIDTESDWKNFVNSLAEIDHLVIEIPKIPSNPIISAYREATLKAYCYRLGVYCKKISFKHN